MSFTAIIQADIDNFESNLDKAQAALDKFSDGVGKKLAKIGGTLQMLGGALSLGVTTPLVAAGTAAYNMAADFEDALGATDQIFKDSADNVKDWANNLETYFGISKKEALEYQNMMGSMLVNIGNLTEEQAAKQGAKLIELAGDLTAMYGGRTQDAVRALTGSLKGNNTMLDNYGMAVNDALVKTRALELGLIKQGQEMSLSAKQAATLSLIYEQTGAAQGQAAREADGASGSIRALQTEIANLSTELGTVLLPVITPIISNLRDMVAGFRSISPEVQKTIVTVAGFAAALGPLLLGLGTVLKMAPLVGAAFATITGPVGIAIAAIAAAATLIIKNWDKIKEYFTNGNGARFWTSISENAKRLWNSLVTIFNTLRAFITDVWAKIGSNVMSYVTNAFNIVLAVVDSVISNVTDIINFFSALIRGDFKGAIGSIGNMFTNSFNLAKTIVTNVLAGISQQISGFLKLVGAESLGRSLENWANGLTPIKTETQAVSEKVEESTEKINTQTAALKSNTDATTKAGKGIKDYRKELDQLLASWGIYEAQMSVINTSFREINTLAKNAGASLEELGFIARKELGEKLSLSLDISSYSLKKSVDSVWNDARKSLGDKFAKENRVFDIPLYLNPVLRSGVYEPGKLGAMSTYQKEILQSFQDMTDRINYTLSSGISSGISNMFSSIGEAMASGENVLGAIGDSLLKSLGGLAKSIGEQMIAFGTAGIALKQLMMNPYLAIAAGAALVALGSFAQSSIGKQTSNYNGGSVAAKSVTVDYNAWRGSLYNNDKQVVEIVAKGDSLRGWMKTSNERNNRLG